jgi:hypothetical protein
MKYVDIRDLPPCDFGPQCLRLLDDLDLPALSTSGWLTSIEDLQDRRRMRQLRSHLATCPTCSALLADARRVRAQQRLMVYNVLKENEQQVPSTAHRIIEAMRQTQAQGDTLILQEGSMHAQRLSPMTRSGGQDDVLPPLQTRSMRHSWQRQGLCRSMLTLATVAVVILAVGLLNHFVDQPTPTSSGSSPLPFGHQPPPPSGLSADTYGWDTVLFGLTVLSASGMVKGFTFYTYEAPADNLARIVVSTRTFVGVNMEGVSHDGRSLLYDLTSRAQHIYTIYSSARGVHNVYQVPADAGGNAIWIDDSHILVQARAGLVVELDTQNGAILRTWPIRANRLVCYHQPFLYFVNAQHAESGTLYRANLSTAKATPQYIIDAQPDTHFWFNAAGTTIFYARKGAAGQQGIYTVRSDGTDARLLRAGSGLPIGYTDDNALLLLEQVSDRLEIVRLGGTPAEAEHVLLANAAPGATSLCGTGGLVAVIQICDGNVALEPYGEGLLLHAYYANGSHSLVYDNLVTGASRTILTLPANTTVQLPGWSKMSTAPAAGQISCRCA